MDDPYSEGRKAAAAHNSYGWKEVRATCPYSPITDKAARWLRGFDDERMTWPEPDYDGKALVETYERNLPRMMEILDRAAKMVAKRRYAELSQSIELPPLE